MWKKQKVKAGVLLYAVTMAAIFSLLLQFYLNRQVAHHKDFALNKEKLIAFAMAKRSKDKAEQESGERVFNLGKVRYQNTKTGFATSVRMNKGNYEFLFPTMKTQEKKRTFFFVFWRLYFTLSLTVFLSKRILGRANINRTEI